VSAPTDQAPRSPTDAGRAGRTQVRGSSLLLVGRILSMGINFAVQILVVRHLSRGGYGSFAYALSMVSLATTVVTFGLDRAVTRFIAIYDERGEPGKVLGTLVMVVGTVTAFGFLVVVGTMLARGFLGDAVMSDPDAATLFILLVGLAPIQALDTISIGMFAVLERPGAIFVRRHVLAPLLRLAVVGALIVADAGTRFLALGYLVTGALALVLYSGLLVALLRQRGILTRATFAQLEIPVREVLWFTVPLLTSDLVYAVMNVSDAIMLGHFRDAEALAGLRAVQPVAKLSEIVMTSFAVMFMPLASRLFARRDRAGVAALYWQTASWMTVLSFPVFVTCFALAEPLTVAFFGDGYADAAPLLSVLAMGYYLQVAVGFNGLTLKAVGAVRILVMLNIGAAVTNLVLNLVLIPRFGAVGAAVGTTAALAIHNVFKQWGLHRATGISLFEPAALRLYGLAMLITAAVTAIQISLSPPLLVGLLAAAVGSLVLLAHARPLLRIATAFPELLRFRVLRSLIGAD
jgi:O-antigen/teichoic acid export membrane protein